MHSKRLLLLLIVCVIWLLLCPQPALHAQGWQWQNPLPQGDNLNLVFFADRQHGWITSDGPILLHTRNRGKNWEILRTGIVFTDIHFINPSEGWGIGNPHLDVIKWNIYHTNDGGKTWEVQLADTTARYDIFFLDNEHGWATSNGTIPDVLFFTSDGGKTWEPQAQRQFRLTDEIHGITFLNRSKGWAVGGLLWGIRTRDSGETWERDSSLAGVNQLFFADSLHGWGITSYRDVVRTIDGGETWERIRITDAFGEVRGNHFFAFDTNRCLIALNIGLYASSDGGQNWTEFSPQALNSFAFLDSLEGWGVLGHRLYQSINRGRTWQNLTNDIVPEGVIYFSSVDFINAKIGWVAGRTQKNDGIILNTRDGGLTWTEQWRDSGKRFEQIFFINDRHGWAMGFGGYINHTNNSGLSWQIQNSGTDFNLRAATFVDSLNGWAVGDKPVENKGVILHTQNGGRTWLDQTPFDIPSLFAVTFIDSLNGWAVGKIVLHTKDGGKSWIIQRQATGLIAISFTDKYNGWATGYDPQTDANIIHTNDGGTTWHAQPLEYIPHDLTFVDNLHGWAIGLFGRIYYTTNGGDTWREQQSNTSQSLNAIDFVDKHSGWTVGWYGAILHTTNGGVSTVKLRSLASSLPKRFILHGNYPNPFNAQTKIRFEISGSKARVRLSIYDLQGHLLAKLIDDERSPGLHEVGWHGTCNDGSACTSGLYFYQVEVNSAMQIGKAILLK